MNHYMQIPSIYVLLTRGGGVLPMMVYKGRPRPKGVRVGKSVIWVCERAQKGEQMKSRKCSIFVIDSCLKDSAFITVKRDAKF